WFHCAELPRSTGLYCPDPSDAPGAGGAPALCAGVPVTGAHTSSGAGYPGRPRTQQLYRTGECLRGRASRPQGRLSGPEPCPEIPALPLSARRAGPALMNRPALRRPPDWPQYLAGRAETARHPLLRDFYRADWPGADTPLAELEFAALDIETTGL